MIISFNDFLYIYGKSHESFLICKIPWAYFLEQFSMATSGNESIQLCMPKTKASYTSLYIHSNGFVEAWNVTSIDKSIDIFFDFYLVMKKVMKTMNLVIVMQNLVANHQSWPIKLNRV